jgi:hypothetical protein
MDKHVSYPECRAGMSAAAAFVSTRFAAGKKPVWPEFFYY